MQEAQLEQPQPIIILPPPSETPTNRRQIQSLQDQGNTLIPKQQKKSSYIKRYGNFVVFSDNHYFPVMLGPDYLCFIPTFLFFLTISFLLASYILTHIQNTIGIIATIIVCIIQPISYAAVGLSDPGIVHEKQSLKSQRKSFCRKCRFNVPDKSFHCPYCDVCIEGYDHHCPWTSKCIGKKNLIQFYVFLISTPIFIVYCAFAFGFTMEISDRPHNLRKVG